MSYPVTLYPPYVLSPVQPILKPREVAPVPPETRPDHTFRYTCGIPDSRNIIAKQPVEAFNAGMDFSTELSDVETITSVVSIAELSETRISGLAAQASILDGDTVVWPVSGGVVDDSPVVTITVETDFGHRRVLKGTFCIKDEISNDAV